MKPPSSGTTPQEERGLETPSTSYYLYAEKLDSTVRIVRDGLNFVASLVGQRDIDDIFGVGATDEEAVEDLEVALWENLDVLADDEDRLANGLRRQLRALRRLRAQVAAMERTAPANATTWTTRAAPLAPEATTVAAFA